MPLFGNHGLWMALSISYLARGVTLFWKYFGIEAEV
jgi:multidrug resistance protein, MATE family